MKNRFSHTTIVRFALSLFLLTPLAVLRAQTVYEGNASANAIEGTAVVESCSGCLNGTRIGNIGNGNANYLRIKDISVPTTGTYTVTLYYTEGSDGGARSFTVQINDGAGPTLSGLTGSSWTEPATPVTFQANFTAGSGNSVGFFNASGSAPDVDHIVVSSTGGGGTPTGNIFAPFEYVGDLGDANQIPGIISASGVKAVILAFLTPDNNGCSLTWPGANGPLPNDTVGSTSMATVIADLQAAGVTVIISQGGAGGQEAAAYCGTAAETQAVYQMLITQYHVKWLDFDVEYSETSGQPSRRAQALAALQAANPGLIVSYTLPLGPGGLDSGTGGGTTDLTDAKAAGLDLNIVNGMAMDFGGTNENQPQLAEEGAAALKSQIQSAGLTSTVGLTFLPGTSDDTPPNYFTLANATTMLDWAEANKYVTLLSFWELNRDNGGCPGSTVDEDTCSGVSQSKYEFSSIFNPF
jgi:Glycosyl hydrolases family 18